MNARGGSPTRRNMRRNIRRKPEGKST